MEAQPHWQDTVVAVGTLVAVGVSVAVAIWEIVRSRHATEEAQKTERIATAGLVSAWVEEQYLPDESGSFYIRYARVHLANEANEPVFRVTLSVGVGFETRSIGPLAVPAPIPVLSPRRSFTWDITLPLRAHDDTESPCAEIGFTDPRNRRWLRKFDGSLDETTGKTARLLNSDDMDGAERQIGRLGDPGNPMAVAMGFLNLITEDEIDLDLLRQLLAPEARGWEDLNAEGAEQLKAGLSHYGLGGYVHYPAPHVAHVKILPEQSTHMQVVGGEPVLVTAKIITLTYIPERGWRVFSCGLPTEADRILFPEGSLSNL